MNKQSQHQAGLVLLWSLSLLVGWRPLAGAFALAWRDDQYTHILLICHQRSSHLHGAQVAAPRGEPEFCRRDGILALSVLIAFFAWSGRLRSPPTCASQSECYRL